MTKKIKKTTSILCSVCALAFTAAGIALKSSNLSASADGTIASQTLFVAENATVTGDASKGVTVASDAAYTGTMQYIFNGDSDFRFTFPEEASNWINGDFVVKVADVNDATNYFEVVYKPIVGAWNQGGKWVAYTGANVRYDGEYRSSRYYNSSTEWYNVEKYAAETTLCAPAFRSTGHTMAWGSTVGILQFTWKNDVLSVNVNEHRNQNMRTLAAFDGTEEFVSGTSWGLPKLSFENGYVVSFSSNFTTNNVNDHGTDVQFHLFKDGNTTIDLKNASVSAPTGYTAYMNKKWIDIESHDDYQNYPKGSKINIPNATWHATGSDEKIAVDSVKVVRPSGAEDVVQCGGEYVMSEVGRYKVVYKAGDSENSFSFTVVGYQAVAASELLTVTGATAQEGKNQDGHYGLTIDAVTGERYRGDFYGLFDGEAEIEFAFPNADKAWNLNARGEEFAFIVSDANGEEVFRVVYRNGDHYTQTYVLYVDETGGEQYRFHSHNVSSAGWKEAYGYQLPGSEDGFFVPALGASENGKSGKMQIKTDGDVVRVLAQYKDGRMMEIAAFDGVDVNAKGVIVATEFEGWGLPKIADRLKDGFKISFETLNPDENKLISVTMMKVNGVALVDEGYVDTSYSFDVKTSGNAKRSGKEFYLPEGEALGDVTGVYTLSIGGTSWGYSEKVSLTVSVDTSAVGDKTFVVSDESWKARWQAVSETYTVHVEQAYTLSFDTQGGEEIDEIVYSEHTADRVAVPTPERLFWVFTGWKIGNDSWDGDVQSLLLRNVTLTATWRDELAPTIYLNDGVLDVSTALKGSKIVVSVRDVVASDEGAPERVVVTYEVKTPQGDWTTVLDGYELTLEALGNYQVRYTATDEDGYSSFIVRTIQAIERTSPVVTVADGYQSDGVVGQIVALAQASAVDEDGETLNVKATVVFDGSILPVSNGMFVIAQEGEYVVTFTATDSYGLIGTASYSLTAVADTEAPVIIAAIEDQTVVKGTVITVPTGVATDNVSGNLKVTLTVSYGTETVALEDGKFTAAQNGVYTIVYQTADTAGNVAEKIVKITVTNKEYIEDKKDENQGGNDQQGGADSGSGFGCNGCQSSMVGAPVVVSLALGLAFVSLKKKREDK